MMPEHEVSGTCFSIQASYLTYITASGVLVCDNIINVPTAKTVIKLNAINRATYKVIPVVELIMPNTAIGVKLLTNEGITVNPVPESAVEKPIYYYEPPRVYLVLPPGTTGVKKVFVDANENVTCALDFAVMPEPYNYDGGLFSVLAVHVNYGLGLISVLDGRVDALESKTDNLKLTTKTPAFTHIELPKGEGKQTINIENDVLFYHTSFSYPISAEVTTHNPKITLHGGGRDLTYTLSLTKTTNTVSIDLMTGMIIVYAGVTGEILQQFKLAIPYNGFETLSFENFDDIDDTVLRLTLKGACVV